MEAMGQFLLKSWLRCHDPLQHCDWGFPSDQEAKHDLLQATHQQKKWLQPVRAHFYHLNPGVFSLQYQYEHQLQLCFAHLSGLALLQVLMLTCFGLPVPIAERAVCGYPLFFRLCVSHIGVLCSEYPVD